MAPSPELLERAAPHQGTGSRAHLCIVLSEVRTTIGRTTQLLEAHQEALAQLRAKLARHADLCARTDGAIDTRYRRPGNGQPIALTPRQLEILGYLAQGQNTAQIAERLWLSRATVRNHVSGILSALECHSRLEAVAKARRLGLI